MNQLGIFAKYWQPGQVKTRLAADVGDDWAAQIYREFVVCLTRRLDAFEGRRVVAFSPAERKREFATLVGEHWQLEPQAGADLGRRMEHYFRRALAAGADRVLLIGSDSPTLSLDRITAALTALAEHEVVLGPTEDGGYYLVGAAGQVADMFRDIPWSTPEVWNATRDRLEGQGINWHALPELYDVDDRKDLWRLRQELALPPCAGTEFNALRRVVA